MKTTIGLALLGLAGVACASGSPQGPDVKVYQAELTSEGAPAPPLPQGCRLVGASGPIDEQEEARHIKDPYRSQRKATAASGGNVLLVKYYNFMTLKRTECAESQAKDCEQGSAQNWYKTSFGYYACDASAQAVLAELKPEPKTGLFVWTFNKKSDAAPAPAPAAAPTAASATVATAPVPPGQPAAATGHGAALKAKVLALVQEGVGEDVISAYVRSHRPTPPLTAEEIIDWKKAGISETVIRATFAN